MGLWQSLHILFFLLLYYDFFLPHRKNLAKLMTELFFCCFPEIDLSSNSSGPSLLVWIKKTLIHCISEDSCFFFQSIWQWDKKNWFICVRDRTIKVIDWLIFFLCYNSSYHLSKDQLYNLNRFKLTEWNKIAKLSILIFIDYWFPIFIWNFWC